MGKKKKNKEKESPGCQVITVNRKARFNYHIDEVLEAGIVLTGNEIKSIRDGGISLAEAYVRPQKGEIFLLGAHIREYEFSNEAKYDPIRPRKLLLHKRQIDKLRGRVEMRGMTIVPLRVYIKNGLAKLEIALAKGKAAPDKRKSLMASERDREAERAMKFKD